MHTYQCVCLSGFANGACGYTDYITEYTAACTVDNSAATAFSGNCDVDVDECDSSPCVNGATCTDSADNSAIPVHAYKCACAAGYANGDCAYTTITDYTGQCMVALGGNCDIDVDECESDPCQNGGTCTDSTSNGTASIGAWDYTCTCVNGYENSVGNQDCSVDIDECASNKCVNGAT